MTRQVLNIDYPSVEERISESTEIWIKDLKSLFDNAKDRFGDLTWESENENSSNKIWAHKAIIYSRAPKAFRERYFQPKPTNHSIKSLSTASPSISPSYHYLNLTHHPSASQLSLLTTDTQGTIKYGEDGVMQLLNDETPELFATQLEWLYTGEGLGDVVQWMETDSDNDSTSNTQSYMNAGGSFQERREKLGQDLTYMWRSKLYADVRIHLENENSIEDNENSGIDSDNSTDSLSSTLVFTSHRFILASRSPYFASVLLNSSEFKSTSALTDIYLPNPPFTPASLHFILGYIYAGNLEFSNRKFNLSTSFQIHKSASYLQLDSLVDEIESRIVNDFCHGLDWDLCKCKKCLIRSCRIWKFSILPEVSSLTLEYRSKIYLCRSWCKSFNNKEIGLSTSNERQSLIDIVKESINSNNLISTFQNINSLKLRLEQSLRINKEGNDKWIIAVEEMIDQIEFKAMIILRQQFQVVATSVEIWDLISSNSFNTDLLENIMNRIVNLVGSSEGCYEAPIIYQTIVSSLLMRLEADSIHKGTSIKSRSRSIIEFTKNKILANIGKRWMQIRDLDGFKIIDPWALKEISDEIEVSIEDLTWNGNSQILILSRNTRSNSSNVDNDDKSIKSITPIPGQSSRIPPSQSETNNNPIPTSQSQSGLKRLRLRSSVSTTSSIGTPSRTSARYRSDISERTTTPTLPGSRSSSTALNTTPSQSRLRSSPSESSRSITTGTDKLRPLATNTTPKIAISRTARTAAPASSSSITSKDKDIGSSTTTTPTIAYRRRLPSSTTKSPVNPVSKGGEKAAPRILKPPIPSISEKQSISKIPNGITKSNEQLPRGPPLLTTTKSISSISSIRKLPTNSPKRPSLSPSTQNSEDKLASCKKWDGPGFSLQIGIPCVVSVTKSTGKVRFKANIRYIGHMNNSKGPWIGVEAFEISKLGIKALKAGVKDDILYFQKSNTKSNSKPTVNEIQGKRINNNIDNRNRTISKINQNRQTQLTNNNELEVLFVRPSEIVFIMDVE